ncbi:MAG: phytoene/squalene synthase family protein [Sphingomonadales bacterium]|jgi:phytoene synthase
MSIQLFDKTSSDISKRVALNYSTSFSLGIRLLAREYRWAVFAIYGFVRVADEIVDTFHNHDKRKLLQEFKEQTYAAIEAGISTNPVLHSFQMAVHQFGIGKDLIEPFFVSMALDLDKNSYDDEGYETYIYGSAEVVGLMCLRVFCNNNQSQYDALLPHARSLGAAFQKVNFLRDLKSDIDERGRIYFPGVDFDAFSEKDKIAIISDIKKDFADALIGIKKLPVGCRLGVYTAYIYYLKLLEKIQNSSAEEIAGNRIRIPNGQKLMLLAKSYVKERMMRAAL